MSEMMKPSIALLIALPPSLASAALAAAEAAGPGGSCPHAMRLPVHSACRRRARRMRSHCRRTAVAPTAGRAAARFVCAAGAGADFIGAPRARSRWPAACLGAHR
jgi:hypothetical protein